MQCQKPLKLGPVGHSFREFFFMNDNFMTPFDLVGDPIPEGWGKHGRPPHQPTDDNRSKIRVLLAFGYLVPAIAKALRINKGRRP